MSAADNRLRRQLAGQGPLTDPVEGDVIERGGKAWTRWTMGGHAYGPSVARRVVSLWGGRDTHMVTYQATPRSLGVSERWCSLRAWRAWAKGARIVCRGAQ